MASSPESRAHMSAAAEVTFLLGAGALVTAGFSALLVVTMACAAGAVACGVVGMITTRDRDTAGGALSGCATWVWTPRTATPSRRGCGSSCSG